MNPYRLITVAAILMVTIYAIKVYAGSITMTTYYQQPLTHADTLKAGKVLILPCYSNSNPAPSTLPNNSMWIDMGSSSC